MRVTFTIIGVVTTDLIIKEEPNAKTISGRLILVAIRKRAGGDEIILTKPPRSGNVEYVEVEGTVTEMRMATRLHTIRVA